MTMSESGGMHQSWQDQTEISSRAERVSCHVERSRHHAHLRRAGSRRIGTLGRRRGVMGACSALGACDAVLGRRRRRAPGPRPELN